jgi:hypothetical protein
MVADTPRDEDEELRHPAEWARNGIRCVEHDNTTSENYLRLPGMFTARRVRLIDNATQRRAGSLAQECSTARWPCRQDGKC